MISTDQNGPQRRFGNRMHIAQPAMLRIENQLIRGSLNNVGLFGAFFNTPDLPARGSRGLLTCEGSHGVEVRVVWHRGGNEPGVGLAFDSTEFQR